MYDNNRQFLETTVRLFHFFLSTTPVQYLFCLVLLHASVTFQS